jgi:hypothetical protein
MAGPTIIDTPGWKLTFFVQGGVWGWTENWYYVPSGSDLEGDAIAASKAYGQLRDNYIPNPWAVNAARYTDLSTPGSSRLLFAGDLGIPAVESASKPAPVWLGPLTRVGSATGNIRRMMIWRGMTVPNAITWTPNPGFQPLPGNVGEFLARMSALLANGTVNGKKVFGGQFCLKARVNGTLATTRYTIRAGGLDTATAFMAYQIDTNPGWAPGQYVRVQNIRGGCNKGLSGVFRVIRVDPPVSPSNRYTIVVNKIPCCRQSDGKPAPVIVTPGGTISLLVGGLVAVGGLNFERIVPHKTGRAFFGTVGRRPGKCC